MTKNVRFAIVLSTKTKWIMNCLQKPINSYALDKNKNLSNLGAYAKKLRVYKKVTEVMEALING